MGYTDKSTLQMLEEIKRIYNFNNNQLADELGVEVNTVYLWSKGTQARKKNYNKIQNLYKMALKEKEYNEDLTGVENKTIKEMFNTIMRVYNLSKGELARKLKVGETTICNWLSLINGNIRETNYYNIKKLYEAAISVEDIEDGKKTEYTNEKEYEVENVTNIDLFDDVKKIHYSLKLKEAFGLPISNILTNFDWWIKENEKNQKNYYDGYYWHTASIELMYENWFKYSFPDIKVFEEKIEQLVQNGVVIRVNPTNFNVCDFYFWRIDKERLYEFYKHIKK